MSKFVSLKSITSKIGSGATPRGGQDVYKDRGISLIRSQNVLDFKFGYDGLAFIDEEQASKLEGVTVQNKDVLLNITGDSIARVCIVPDDVLPARVNQHVSIIRCKDGICSKYVLYYLQYLKPYLLRLCRVGGTRNALTKEAIEKLKIRFRDDQFKIGAILAALDAKIELNNRINAELESLAKTIYDYWFVQFDFPNTDGKPYKSSGGEMVYVEEGNSDRAVPAGWEIGTLRNWIDFKRGISYKSAEIQDTGIPMLNLNSFTLEGKFKPQGTKYFNGSFKETNKLNHGDLLIAITDVTRNATIIGKAFIVPDLFEEQPLMSCDVACVISKSDFNNYYLKMLFNSEQYHEYIKHFASGTLVLHLDLNGMLWFQTFMPPKYLLDKFAKFKQSIIEKQTINIKENQQLTQLRDWLLPMLMNGQVSIK